MRSENTLQHTAQLRLTAWLRIPDDSRNIYLPRLHSLPLQATTEDCHRGHWPHAILSPQCQAAPGKLAQVIREAQCGWYERHCHPQQIGPLPGLLLESCPQGLAKLLCTQCSIHLQIQATSWGRTRYHSVCTRCSDQAHTHLSCHLRIEVLSLHLLATGMEQVLNCLDLQGCRY